jgi:hypothetical protein
MNSPPARGGVPAQAGGVVGASGGHWGQSHISVALATESYTDPTYLTVESEVAMDANLQADGGVKD